MRITGQHPAAANAMFAALQLMAGPCVPGAAVPGKGRHHRAHLAGNRAMAFMLAAIPAPSSGAGMLVMGGNAGPGLVPAAVPVLAPMLAVFLLGHAVVTAGNLRDVLAPASWRSEGVLTPRLAGSCHITMSMPAVRDEEPEPRRGGVFGGDRVEVAEEEIGRALAEAERFYRERCAAAGQCYASPKASTPATFTVSM